MSKRAQKWLDARPPRDEIMDMNPARSDVDITNKFKFFFNSQYAIDHIPPEIYSKIEKSLEYLTTNNLQIHFIERGSGYLGIELISAVDQEVNGYFLTTNPSIPNLKGNTLSIYTEMHEGKGLARLMVAAFVFEIIQRGKMTLDTLLFVGGDSSSGFWRSIGMVDTRHRSGNFKSFAGGYELSMDLGGFSKWALGYRHERPFVGGKTRKYRSKKRKTTTRRRRRHKRSHRRRHT